MNKSLQISFAAALFVTASISCFSSNLAINNIISIITIPIFFLSISSFLNEILETCNNLVVAKAKAFEKPITSNYSLFENDIKYTRLSGIHWKSAYYIKSFIKIIKIIILFSYVLLFLSLIFSFNISEFINVNYNSLNLWSFFILFSTIELKSEIAYVFSKIIIFIIESNYENEN